MYEIEGHNHEKSSPNGAKIPKTRPGGRNGSDLVQGRILDNKKNINFGSIFGLFLVLFSRFSATVFDDFFGIDFGWFWHRFLTYFGDFLQSDGPRGAQS